MVQVTISSLVPSTPPTDGWRVGYRVLGTTGAFLVPVGSPFMTQPIVFTTTDAAGTLYELQIKRDCGALESTEFITTTPCQCSAGYVVSPSEKNCQQVNTIAPTVTNSGYCLAPSTDGAYSGFESRIYMGGFAAGTLTLPPGSTGGLIYGRMTLSPQWANIAANLVDGPMNREGVWIDADCNGTRDPLSGGQQTTIAFMYNNPGPPKTVYVGMGADNQWKLVVNGVQVAEMFPSAGQLPFKIWHIMPVGLVTGVNYINGIAQGDGSVQDSIGMVVYDNTPAQILAASNDAALNILFKTSSLRGTSYDVTTCPSGYSLDVSSGQGNYICVRTTYKICNSADT